MPKAPKPINDTTFEVELFGKDKIEIGDIESVDFKPHLKLNRWDGECFIKVQMAGDIDGEVEYGLEGDKVKTKYKIKYGDFEQEVETEFYPLEPTEQYELGGFEFEIILKEKPATNKIVLNIESQGLKFYYQPPLTQEEIDKGAFRPDNIVGSYAVYHATKGGLVDSRGKDYKAGKAFHIFRPRIEDAVGNWVWGTLHYDEQAGTLTTTIPQDFLDTAVYPIRHAAGDTFGVTGEGGSSISCSDRLMGSFAACPSAGDGISISAYLRAAYGAYDMKCALFEYTSENLIQGTNALTDTVEGWNTFTFPSSPSLTAQSYWIMGWSEKTGGTWRNYLAYDSSASAGGQHSKTYNSFPANLNPVSKDYLFSIYVTYTPSNGGVTFYQSLLATAIGVSSVSKLSTYQQIISASAAGVSVLTRVATHYLTLAASATGTPQLLKGMAKTLAATAVGSSALNTVYLTSRTLGAVAQATPGIATRLVTGGAKHAASFILKHVTRH